MQPLAHGGTVETLDHETVMVAGVFPCGGFCHAQATGVGQDIDHHFPGADIVFVVVAGELGDPQGVIRIHHAGFGAGATQ
ncbi:hypothetical protein D3C81_2163710 [compost metagenome]